MLYSSPLTAAQTLDGGEVLPGFRLPVHQVFAEPTPGADHEPMP